jgi:hypothetical protein
LSGNLYYLMFSCYLPALADRSHGVNKRDGKYRSVVFYYVSTKKYCIDFVHWQPG